MKLYTFTGETPAEALKKAQQECGEDALVVNTKEIRKRSLNTPSLYEVVVASEGGGPEANETGKTPPPEPPKKPVMMDDDDVLLNLSETVKQISKIAQVTEEESLKKSVAAPVEKSAPVRSEPNIAQPQAPTADGMQLKDIQGEIAKLTDKVKLIQNMMWDKQKERSGLAMPPEFAEIFRLAKESGMIKEHIDEIMNLTLEHMPLSMRQNSETVKRYFNVLLRKLAPVRVENRLTKPNKKIIMLVGPTGVGKTTTIAKLAARFAYKKDVKYRVGIITVDTYRIGAVEQLMHYAKIMKLGIESVEDPQDFSRAINSLKHCDYIMIDTAGSSQHDHEKINRLKQLLEAEAHTSIDVSLVLSANTKFEDLRDIYKKFSVLGIDTIIATKLDETQGFGNIFSLVYENRKPISYFSVGQEVPDDLQPATADFFVDCLLNGFQSKEN